MGQIGDLCTPGKLLQNAAHKQQASDVDGGRQVLGAQIDKPAEDVGIAAQLIQRTNGGMLLAKIDQKRAGDGTILTGRGRSEGCRQGVNGSLELLHQWMFQRSVAAEFHDARPWYGSDVLRHGFRILLIDLERGDFDIDHRRFNPRVAHQLHQGR